MKGTSRSKHRFISGFGVMTFIVLALGAVGYYGAVQNSRSLEEVGGMRLPGVQALLIIKEASTAIKSAQRTLLKRNLDETVWQRQYFLESQAIDASESARLTFETLPRNSKEDSLWREFGVTWDEYLRRNDKFFHLSHDLHALRISDPLELERDAAVFRSQHCELEMSTLKACYGGPVQAVSQDTSWVALDRWRTGRKTENPDLLAALRDIESSHRKVHASIELVHSRIRTGDFAGARELATGQVDSEARRMLARLDRIQLLAAHGAAIYNQLDSQAMYVCRSMQLKAVDLLDRIVTMNTVSAHQHTAEARTTSDRIKLISLLVLIGGVIIAYRDVARRKAAENGLKTSLLFTERLIDAAPIALAVVGSDRIIRKVNEAAGRVLGAKPSELAGRNWSEFNRGGESELAHLLLQEGTLQDVHGRAIPVMMSVISETFDDQEAIFIVAFLDLTDSKQLEIQVQQARELKINGRRTQVLLKLNQMTYATLHEITEYCLEAAVSITQSEIGYLAFLNDDETILTMHSWSKAAMRDCATVDRPLVYRVEDTGLWGEAVRQRRAVITNDYAAPNPLKKGCPAGHVEVRRHMNVPIFAGGHIVLVVGVGNKALEYGESDVEQLTLLMEGMWRLIERMNTQQALSKSEHRYRIAGEQTGQVVYDWEMSSGRIDWVGAIAAVTGYSAEEFQEVGIAEWTEMIHAEDREVVIEKLEIARKSRARFQAEYRLRRKDGSCVYVEDSGIFIIDDHGGAYRMLGTMKDISERRQAQAEREQLIHELESKNAELERFVYTASHDLKAPLITISGFTGLLKMHFQEGADDLVNSDMERIIGAANKMAKLLDSLLEISRIGRKVNPSEVFSLNDLAREVTELLAGGIRESGVEVTILPGLPIVTGDRPRLQEVLQNLLHNAIKYTGDQPEPRVEIGCEKRSDEMLIFVKDNGIGIPSRFHERVFELFEQLDPSADGAGVGLALAKRIIEHHGGRIWVESEGLNRGSTFYFTLPDISSAGTCDGTASSKQVRSLFQPTEGDQPRTDLSLTSV